MQRIAMWVNDGVAYRFYETNYGHWMSGVLQDTNQTLLDAHFGKSEHDPVPGDLFFLDEGFAHAPESVREVMSSYGF